MWSTGSSKTLVVWCVESPCRGRPVLQQYHHNHQICADRVTCFGFSDRGASLALVGVGLSKSETRARKKPKDGSFHRTRLFFPPSSDGSEGSFGSFDLVCSSSINFTATTRAEPITFPFLFLFVVVDFGGSIDPTIYSVHHVTTVTFTKPRSQGHNNIRNFVH